MFRSCVAFKWVKRILAVGVLSVALGGCGGGSGGGGGVGIPGGSGGTGSGGATGVPPYPQLPAKTLTMTIDSVTIPTSNPVLPVVNFTVTDENTAGYVGLREADLRFNVAKLTPGTGGYPSIWQNYINSTRTNTVNNKIAMRGSTETPKLYLKDNPATVTPGALVDHGNGKYTYTFYTDLNLIDKSVTCPPPCVDAQGKPLDTTYNPTLTHRVGVYIHRSSLPPYSPLTPPPTASATKDIRPSDGAQSGLFSREIVAAAKCNECHNKLKAHDGRTDTKLCVTCHNPGSWEGITGNTVDFKVLIHKIHRGSSLPSVIAGKPYMIGTDDFSDVAFPQEIRNCTKCHDGTNYGTLSAAPNVTSEGDNWKTGLSRAACGSCHDNIDFTVSGAATYAVTKIGNRTGHSGNIVTDDSMCSLCHSAGQYGGTVAAIHNNTEAGVFVGKVARDKFKFNILTICGTPVASNPVCAPGSTPAVTFSVTDPTGGTHGYPNSTYNLFSDPEFYDTLANKAVGSMSVDIAWDTRDYNNTGGYAARPGRANQVNIFGTTATSTNYGNPSILAYASVKPTDVNGVYTATALGPIPDGTVFPNVAATGSGVVAIEGRAVAAPLTTIPATTAGLRVPIKGEVAYFRITDPAPVARRVAVDAVTKCDKCHDQLSLHGGSRNDNVQLCVLCHNPNNTDAQASARVKSGNGLPTGVAAVGQPDDGKKEEAIDFKRMIHGIHAGGATSLDGVTPLNGFRTKGILVSGGDFSDVRFPGILNDCTTCHTTGTYELKGAWDNPTQNNILASTIDSTPGLTASSTSGAVNASLQDPSDDLNISPTAAVCSSCHDKATDTGHMVTLGGAVFGDTQANILGITESCSTCHGPGKYMDVNVVHLMQ